MPLAKSVRGVLVRVSGHRSLVSRFASRQSSSTSVRASRTEDGGLFVEWPDGRQSAFGAQFLLDHCRCERCFHPQTKQRLKSLFEFPSDVQVDTAEVTPSGLKVAWTTSTPHESHFPPSFLKRASLLSLTQSQEERILWNSRIAQSPPTVEYRAIMNADDNGVLKCLDKVHDFGFCFVTDVPPTATDTEEVIKRIGPIRETHYGGFWDFTSDMSHGDLAYSSQGLPAHTDTTYFTDPAGLQIFHMLAHQGEGGTTLLVDAFYTASLLSTLYPTSYSMLSRARVPYHASGTPGTLLRPAINQPVLRHNEKGQLVQVRWNNEDRGVLAGWDADQLKSWYEAARRFEELGRSEDAEYRVQLTPGTMLVIDNWRVMHGRSAFTGSRRMCGAYVGADDWRSRREVLRRRGQKADIWDFGW